MSKGNTFENDWLLLVFNNVAISLIGDASGLQPSATTGDIHVSFHTADPGEAGDQSTSEIAYTGYARIAVARTAGGWTVTANSVSPTANVDFGEMTGGAGGTITHFIAGTDLTGTGKLLYSGTVTPNIVVTTGVSPTLTAASTITED